MRGSCEMGGRQCVDGWETVCGWVGDSVWMGGRQFVVFIVLENFEKISDVAKLSRKQLRLLTDFFYIRSSYLYLTDRKQKPFGPPTRLGIISSFTAMMIIIFFP